MSQMAGLSHYCERDHQRTGTGDDCRQEYWKRRHKLNWTGRSNKNYIYREPINVLEELNDQIHETLATVIPNMLRLARENLIKRARLFLQMKGGHFEHLL
jgi:hypothetical protein